MPAGSSIAVCMAIFRRTIVWLVVVALSGASASALPAQRAAPVATPPLRLRGGIDMGDFLREVHLSPVRYAPAIATPARTGSELPQSTQEALLDAAQVSLEQAECDTLPMAAQQALLKAARVALEAREQIKASLMREQQEEERKKEDEASRKQLDLFPASGDMAMQRAYADLDGDNLIGAGLNAVWAQVDWANSGVERSHELAEFADAATRRLTGTDESWLGDEQWWRGKQRHRLQTEAGVRQGQAAEDNAEDNLATLDAFMAQITEKADPDLAMKRKWLDSPALREEEPLSFVSEESGASGAQPDDGGGGHVAVAQQKAHLAGEEATPYAQSEVTGLHEDVPCSFVSEESWAPDLQLEKIEAGKGQDDTALSLLLEEPCTSNAESEDRNAVPAVSSSEASHLQAAMSDGTQEEAWKEEGSKEYLDAEGRFLITTNVTVESVREKRLQLDHNQRLLLQLEAKARSASVSSPALVHLLQQAMGNARDLLQRDALLLRMLEGELAESSGSNDAGEDEWQTDKHLWPRFHGAASCGVTGLLENMLSPR